MIVIHVQANVNADRRADFIVQANKDAQVSRGFPGCVKFNWSEDIEQPNTFQLYEEWESQPAFEAYRTSEDFKRVGERLFPMIVGEPKTAYYNASAL